MVKLEDKIAAGITNVLCTFLGGFTFMLAVGVVHHEWAPAVPTIGYWWSLLFVYLTRASFGRVTARQMAKDREDKELRKLQRSAAASSLATATAALVAEAVRRRGPGGLS